MGGTEQKVQMEESVDFISRCLCINSLVRPLSAVPRESRFVVPVSVERCTKDRVNKANLN